MDKYSIIQPIGMNASTCGYCGAPGKRSTAKSSVSYGIWAHTLTTKAYQELLDRGWRRSGSYLYHVDNERTCCPQVPIRLKASDFKISKSQRRALSNLEEQVTEVESIPELSGSFKAKGRYARASSLLDKWRQIDAACGVEQDLRSSAPPICALLSELAATKEHQHQRRRALVARLHNERCRMAQRARQDRKQSPRTSSTPALALHGQGSENGAQPAVDLMPLSHFSRLARSLRLKTSLVPGAYTQEKYDLFTRYQMRIHHEAHDKVSKPDGFARFLCDAPFPGTQSSGAIDLQSPDAVDYGLYHHEYRLNDKLIAVGVLDLLPTCLSSVYLFYDPDYAHLELGKVSALREIALVLQLQRKAGLGECQWYYLGFFIRTCPKMAYKGDYQPSELLDVHANEWKPFKVVNDSHIRQPIAPDEALCAPATATASELTLKAASVDKDMNSSASATGFLDPTTLSAELLSKTLILPSRGKQSHAFDQRQLRECVAALAGHVEGFVITV
ncbi:Arginyl-tRNA-protein transferase [Ceraceosorus bombacis]|uniref:Arginyl-tRNA--protein transferase 1 n=1 Tax=Ceraceosorus bombacis TaxID=401625 RepID=A0A0P1BF98_9BASI|nr:Arginyl-tRNA-protein transferase [Ceraceosorus bombacis]